MRLNAIHLAALDGGLMGAGDHLAGLELDLSHGAVFGADDPNLLGTRTPREARFCGTAGRTIKLLVFITHVKIDLL
jgi:hypothetical protein